MVERIPLGIKNFDRLVEGGLPKGSATLIAGTPGTGKSIFCLQALYYNAMKGRTCLYVSFEQSAEEIKEQMRQFGWEFEKSQPHFKLLATDYNDPTFFTQLMTEVKVRKFDMIAIDSLASVIIDPFEVFGSPDFGMAKLLKAGNILPMDMSTLGRLKVKKIIELVKASGATTLLVGEVVKDQTGRSMSRDQVSDFLSDAVILLQHNPTAGATNRTLTLEKMRLTSIDDLIHPMQITQNGIEIKG
ncbi:MAG: AAA family ATPase [Candidatus Diapherotrites archaeon]|uniref:AAA family ATPase n=1 Tax=Candidatus Iainarchaeum sp. TaxID=3101447 RepID=A0A8T4L2U2_9ARCH|nr:AAA family ATPase [Candidatus Diapherotrites archaeon]